MLSHLLTTIECANSRSVTTTATLGIDWNGCTVVIRNCFNYRKLRQSNLLHKESNLAGANQRDLWDRYYMAVMACFEKFNGDWHKHARPVQGAKAASKKRRKKTATASGYSKARRRR